MSFDRIDCYLISDHYLDPRLRTRSYLRLFFGSLSEIEIGIQSEKKPSDCQYWIRCWSESRRRSYLQDVPEWKNRSRKLSIFVGRRVHLSALVLYFMTKMFIRVNCCQITGWKYLRVSDMLMYVSWQTIVCIHWVYICIANMSQ